MNNSSANRKLSKTQLCKIGQSGGGVLGILLGPLLKTGFPLMKNVLKTLSAAAAAAAPAAAAAAAATDAVINKKMFRFLELKTKKKDKE